MDGLTILLRWRKVPVLVLTARHTWHEHVVGIDAGADDYLAKVFDIEEVPARLRAIIRRSAGNAAAITTIGETELDARQMRVCVRGVPVNLAPQEFRLVSYLMLHSGRIVPQQELAQHLQFVHFERGSNAVEVLVARVRRKLPNTLVETRRGLGYLVVARPDV